MSTRATGSGRRWARRALAAVALAFGAWGLLAFAHAGGGAAQTAASPTGTGAGDPAAGHRLFASACSSCHGDDGEGVRERGPSLRDAGARAADFYLRTGRMPLSQPGHEPQRTDPAYPDDQIDALDAYVGSLGGPPIPTAQPASGSVSRGAELFGSSCAGCHSITGEGGVVVGGFAPALHEVSPTEIAEAVRVGPYLMPSFDRNQISDQDLNSIARYVDGPVQQPDDRGGWGIGHLGPVPEGLVAWAVAIAALLLLARLIGERSEGEGPGDRS
jgi:ubiquinol-cytochrome c reductase cytochrome c subunit